jgi:signal transduction histidine kinase
MENSSGDKHHFDIHASLVFQLGESLISDPVQALVELIKNAYDADSDYAKVIIETSKGNEVENSKFRNTKGYLLVTDNGDGMNDEIIKAGWLTISNSLKREMKEKVKEKDRKTKKGRTPLGDKGLGRFGAQRLGHNIEIFTKPEDEDCEYHVAVSWEKFKGKSKLSEIPITIDEILPTRKKGTSILISDLCDPDYFKGKDARDKLISELSKMKSPYKEIKGFRVEVEIDGNNLKLASFAENILRSSEIRYEINFDERRLHIKGKARLSFIRPPGKKEKVLFRELVEVDNGNEFFSYLAKQAKAQAISLKKSKEDGWFVEYEEIRSLENFEKLEEIVKEKTESKDDKMEIANPGEFHGKVDSFDFSKEGAVQPSVFDTLTEYKTYIKELSGVRVYRDGFGIRVDKDWLKLGKQWTSGLSYYGLKVENTIGYIALSVDKNWKLEETTDREGFKVSPYYNNFFKILQRFVKFTEEAQEFLRRNWKKFLEKHQQEVAKVMDGTSAEDLSERIGKGLSKATSYHMFTGDLKFLLTEKASEVQETIDHIADHLPKDIESLPQLKNAVKLLDKNIKEANGIITKIDEYLKEISDLEQVEKVLGNQIKNLREQMEQIYELASLGLTAEALSHEIHNIADRLAKYTGEIRLYLDNQKRKDPKVFAYVEHVDSSITALRKQMSHLAPSLKYVREKKGDIDIFQFCRSLAHFHRDSLKANGIDVQTTLKTKTFTVHMNEGKLTQIFDNLFLNSDYWLREDIRTKTIRNGRITIIIDKPFVRFYDNGRGVDPSVETTLFEPFVTAKGRGKGRGLGLFIVQQLLDPEGCAISLLPERNKYNRMHIFEIDFTGGVDGK